MRVEQSQPSACCGATRQAAERRNPTGHITELDYQFNTIEQIFYRQKERIQQAANPLIEAAQVMYEAITERITLLAAKTNYPCQYLILKGGILINSDHDMGPFNSCQRFDVIDLATREAKDLMALLHK